MSDRDDEIDAIVKHFRQGWALGRESTERLCEEIERLRSVAEK